MELDHISLLARLKLSESEKNVFASQVGDILNYIRKLNELNTDNIEPTAHVTTVKNVFREDVLRPSLPREGALANAPGQDDSFYRVPKIIE